MFKRILVATDLHEVSIGALQVAVDMAQESQATLAILHVLDLPDEQRHWAVPFFGDELASFRDLVARQSHAAQTRLREHFEDLTRGRTNRPVPELIVRSGRPAQRIVAAAEELGCDLTIVGTHSGSAPLGSVAERVIRTATRPVLVVPSAAKIIRTS